MHDTLIHYSKPLLRTADQFKDILLFLGAWGVWTFPCILIHAFPLSLSHNLTDMNFVSKGSFSFYNYADVLLAT